jgi:drug/metabolite transporter (DMT)-like permease
MREGMTSDAGPLAARAAPPAQAPSARTELTPPSKGAIVASLFAVYVIWGSTYLAMRLALRSFPPFVMAAMRFLAAGGLMYGVLRLRGVPSPTRREWGACLLTGVLLCGVGNAGVAIAEQWVASSVAAVMVGAMPLWAALFAGLYGAWPRPREWVAFLIGLAGVALLNLEGDLRASVPGAIALLLAPAGWALGSILSSRLPLPRGPMASACQMIMGGLVLAVAAVLHPARVHPLDARAVGALVYLVFFGSIIAYSAYGYLLRTVRPAVATSYAYVNPVVAVGLGVGFGNESLTALQLVGGGVIVAAVALLMGAKAKQAPAR